MLDEGETAQAKNIAAARVLSDLVWDLFLLGNPILTLKTNRSDDELKTGVRVSRASLALEWGKAFPPLPRPCTPPSFSWFWF